MTPDEQRLVSLWEAGLRSEGIGPTPEWSPVSADTFQTRHNAFWSAVSGIMPDNEHDEPYWMTQDASQALLDN